MKQYHGVIEQRKKATENYLTLTQNLNIKGKNVQAQGGFLLESW